MLALLRVAPALRRFALAAVAAGLTATTAESVFAQAVPPIVASPGVASGALGNALREAYCALGAATQHDAAAALAANIAYAQALQRYAAGDQPGAAAAALRAIALANSVAPPFGAAPAAASAASPALAPEFPTLQRFDVTEPSADPRAATAAVLRLVASEIVEAESLSGATQGQARDRYARALAAYRAGDVRRANEEGDAAFALASKALLRH